MTNKKKITKSINLESELEAKINNFAKENSMSFSAVIEQILIGVVNQDNLIKFKEIAIAQDRSLSAIIKYSSNDYIKK